MPSTSRTAPSSSTSGSSPSQDNQQTQSALIGTAHALLGQCADLLSSALAPAQLAFESLLMPGATIGKHLRHILDHYRLLLDALADPATTRLSYDRRVRLTLIESSVPDALDAVRTLQAQLEELDRAGDEWLGRRVTLEAVTPADVEVETTCGREMWFVSLHAIHHLASIRVIAVGELDLDLPADFGLAPSTAISRQAAQPAPAPPTPPPAELAHGPTSPSKL